MAKVEIVKNTFNDPDTGKPIQYERLVISAPIEGITQTLELKLSKLELVFAKMLLDAEGEPAQVQVRKANDSEQVVPVRKESEQDILGFLDD